MKIDQQTRQILIRRATMMKLIRQGHERQLDRMNDTVLQGLMQDVGHNMSPKQAMTMLQDLQEIGYVKFAQRFDDVKERYVAEFIMLTSLGSAVVLRRQSNDNVWFD